MTIRSVSRERKFKGIWIPDHIWEHLHLSCEERCLWAEIDSFTDAGSAYYKTNEQAAEELGVSTRSVSRAFAKLEMMGLVTVARQGVRRVAKSTPWRGVHDSLASKGSHIGEEASPHWRSIKNKEKNREKNKNNTIVMPFEDDAFLAKWDEWMQERKDRGLRKMTPRGMQAQLNRLKKISHGQSEKAIAVIDQSIAFNYTGLFPVRENVANKRVELDANEALRWADE